MDLAKEFKGNGIGNEMNQDIYSQLEMVKQPWELLERSGLGSLRKDTCGLGTNSVTKMREQMDCLELGIVARVRDMALSRQSLIPQTLTQQLADMVRRGDGLRDYFKDISARSPRYESLGGIGAIGLSPDRALTMPEMTPVSRHIANGAHVVTESMENLGERLEARLEEDNLKLQAQMAELIQTMRGLVEISAANSEANLASVRRNQRTNRMVIYLSVIMALAGIWQCIPLFIHWLRYWHLFR